MAGHMSAAQFREHGKQVIDWIADYMADVESYPVRSPMRPDARGGGGIEDLASSGGLVALLAALRRTGRDGTNTIYVSSQTHSSLEKAATIAGIGEANVRVVDVDPVTLAMLPEHLDALIGRDLRDGATPTMVCATIGTTSTTALDPVRRIGEICAERGMPGSPPSATSCGGSTTASPSSPTPS